MENQIEKMVKTLPECECDCLNCKACYSWKLCEVLYKSGYRKEKQGEWKIMRIGDGGNVRTCSACLISQTVNVYKGKVMFNYCPYCGAKMKGAE